MVAQTILNQIKAYDPYALWAWGSHNFVALPETKEHLGALKFTVQNCRTFEGKAYIQISLDFNDTYSVKLYKSLEEEIDFQDNVYFDELVPVIDKMLGEKTSHS